MPLNNNVISAILMQVNFSPMNRRPEPYSMRVAANLSNIVHTFVERLANKLFPTACFTQSLQEQFAHLHLSDDAVGD